MANYRLGSLLFEGGETIDLEGPVPGGPMSSVRAWARFYGLDKRQARRLRRRCAAAGFVIGPARPQSVPHDPHYRCMEDH